MTKEQKTNMNEWKRYLLHLIRSVSEAAALLDSGKWGRLANWLNSHPDGMKGRKQPWTGRGLARTLRPLMGIKEAPQGRAVKKPAKKPQKRKRSYRKIYMKVLRLAKMIRNHDEVAKILNNENVPYYNKQSEVVPWDGKLVCRFLSNHRRKFGGASPIRTRRQPVTTAQPTKPHKAKKGDPRYNFTYRTDAGDRVVCRLKKLDGGKVMMFVKYEGAPVSDPAAGVLALIEQLMEQVSPKAYIQG